MELAVAGVLKMHKRILGVQFLNDLLNSKLSNQAGPTFKLHFRQKHTLHCPQGHLWELYGGVLARGIETSMTTRGLAFMRLPSAAHGSPVHTWEHVNMG
ncbi:hypothetical protein JB92DRAFT_1242551 [Gautieria morchelliformis]|nr:hypothetical protein JB92DRAFT_1242551 [Gautieria morchelliformis]